ncbi:hypothetical protein GCM10011391_37650 [Pullulanibacillus camelliae]|uniref:DUF488 domain-containing protein n=1 Tax=Pullulanibacillus camelliae TaxID=1707096 RepID=A0A8J2YN71_9BACL|nr:DUF488 family protein [Pullulanibacillus camelliae]GGE55126.1 hypothetical protein GCM10011391_37650 [Pullulanibacillus camelliae]
MDTIFLKRIYEPYDATDGYRILIDRLWPRGISKADANLTAWLKEVAPTPELRKWFNHQPERFERFHDDYVHELRTGEPQQEALNQIMEYADKGKVTLLYGAKDPMYNHAHVLLEELHLRRRR